MLTNSNASRHAQPHDMAQRFGSAVLLAAICLGPAAGHAAQHAAQHAANAASAASPHGDVSAADAKSAREVIQAQLAALAVDDAKLAFSFAAPRLREMFGTPENFIEMVRTAYPVVYRPSGVAFLKPQWIEGELVQGVHMSDESGVLWLALYRLERQKDRRWRITGCQLVQAAGRVT